MAAAALMLLLGPAPAPTDAFQGRIRAPSLRPVGPRWRTVGAVIIRDDGFEKGSGARRWAARPGPQEGEGGAGGRRNPRGGASVDGDDEDEGDHNERGGGGGKTAGRIEAGGGQGQERRGAWRARSPGGLGLSRTDALSALGVAALTGLAITTARPDLNPAASLASKDTTTAAAAFSSAASSSSVATSSSVLGAKKGYLGWRRLIDVEARAKDQNKGQVTYPVRFVAYLSRFLLNFDEDDRALWARLAREIPFTYTEERVQATRRAQFAALADSVEIGLYDFQVR